MSVRVVADARKAPRALIRVIFAICDSYPGGEDVIVELLTSNGPRQMRMHNTITPCEEFYEDIRALGWAAIPE